LSIASLLPFDHVSQWAVAARYSLTPQSARHSSGIQVITDLQYNYALISICIYYGFEWLNPFTDQ
jgi:hypothetical protein